MATCVDFLSGWAESLLLRRRYSLLAIRRGMTLFASCGQSLCGLVFGLTSSPVVAVVSCRTPAENAA